MERRTGETDMETAGSHPSPNRTCLFDLERKKAEADMEPVRSQRSCGMERASSDDGGGMECARLDAVGRPPVGRRAVCTRAPGALRRMRRQPWEADDCESSLQGRCVFPQPRRDGTLPSARYVPTACVYPGESAPPPAMALPLRQSSRGFLPPAQVGLAKVFLWMV